MSIWVPYDAQRLRRTIRFLVRPQLIPARVLCGVIVAAGLVLIGLDASNPVAYAIVVTGAVMAFAIGPITVARAMRMQPHAIRDGFHLAMDDEWIQMSYPLVETRWRWAGLSRVVETPEVWYILFGKAQAMTIPKDAMTPQQQAEFAGFVSRLQPAPA